MDEPLDDRKRLQLAMRRAALTYAAAAEMLGVSKSGVARMLSGDKPIEPLHKETLTRRASLPEGWWTADLALLVSERWEALLERLERYQERREQDHGYWRTFMDRCVALAEDAVPGIMFVNGIDSTQAAQAREAAQADRDPASASAKGLATPSGESDAAEGERQAFARVDQVASDPSSGQAQPDTGQAQSRGRGRRRSPAG